MSLILQGAYGKGAGLSSRRITWVARASMPQPVIFRYAGDAGSLVTSQKQLEIRFKKQGNFSFKDINRDQVTFKIKTSRD